MADALTILQREGLHIFQVLNDLTLSGIDLSAGYQFIGDSPYIVFNAQPSADVTNCALRNLTVQGELDGLNLLERCAIGAVTSLSGYVENCSLQSTISLSGDTYFYDCKSEVVGLGYPVITPGANDLVTRNFRGSYGIAGMTGGDHSLGLSGGRILFDNTCLGGTAHVRGQPFDIINNAAGTVVTDETDSQLMREVHAANFNRRKYNKTTKVVTLYEADGSTPLAQWDDPVGDLSELVPQ